MSTPLIRNTPWYHRYKEYYICAINNIFSYRHWQPKPDKAVLENFEQETLARFIFESNNIEKEGLSFGETKKIIFHEIEIENKLKTFSELKRLRDVIAEINTRIHLGLLLDTSLLEKIGNLNGERLESDKIAIIAKYENHSKDALTVIRHYLATMEASKQYYEYISKSSLYIGHIRKIFNPDDEQYIKDMAKYYPDQEEPTRPYLLSEAGIKSLHRNLASDLIDPSNSPAGEYRTHPIMTDYESHYPAPEVIDNAMKAFISNYENLEKEGLNPITLAAWASTNLVLIHPFSDFNGRLSRLVMNMILRTTGIPFWTSLRSTKKDRKRYLTALRHYRRGKILSISTLISIQLCSIIDELNMVLEISGLPKMPLLEIPGEAFNPSVDELSKLKFGEDYFRKMFTSRIKH